MLAELIGVLDSFDLGLAAVKDDSAKKGMELIRLKLADSLKKLGLTVLEVKNGDVFDPSKHEVVGEIETGKIADGAVAEELERGYLFADRIIRAAKVKLAKAPPGGK